MAVRQDRGRWVVEFMQGGKRVFRRCPAGVTKAQAQELETRLRRERFDRDELGHKEDLSLQGAIGLWLHDNKRKNQKQAVSEAKQWEPFLKGRLLREAPEVAAEAVSKWRTLRLVGAGTAGGQEASRSRASPPIDGLTAASMTAATPPGRRASDGRRTSPRLPKASTINRRLMLLKAVCKWAYRKGHIQENLSGRIETLREPPHKEVYLTRSQVGTLAEHCSPQTKSAILLLAYTGLRASELLALTTRDASGGTVSVRQSKSGKPRTVPVPRPALSPFRAWLSLSSRPSYWELRKQFIVARKKAKLPATVTLHTLRHTCASWLINAGVDLYTVGKILGHSSPQTTARYAHLATDTLEKAMARLK